MKAYFQDFFGLVLVVKRNIQYLFRTTVQGAPVAERLRY